MTTLLRMFAIFTAATLATACGSSEPKQPDLPAQPDRWVSSVTLDPGSVAKYVGKTKDYLVTTVSSVRDLDGLETLSVGDEVNGIRIGAIKCSFHRKDATYGGEQFMWRGRWGCQAGRSAKEILNSVGSDGEKFFDYISVYPVRL